jgi:hypothetical protein
MPSYSVIAADGRAYGPADEATLALWAREGRLTPDTMLQCHETGAHSPARAVAALQPYLGLSPQMVNNLIQTPQPLVPQPQPQPGAALPYAQPYAYPPAQPYAIPGHALDAFSTPVAVLLHFVTFGIFSWIHFGLMHDRLPRVRHDDPSSVKAICFMLIPFFGWFYWRFFEGIRLCDRINEQRRIAGLPETAPRGLAIAYGVMCIIPYINFFIGLPIIGAVYYGSLRANVNELVYATRGRA